MLNWKSSRRNVNAMNPSRERAPTKNDKKNRDIQRNVRLPQKNLSHHLYICCKNSIPFFLIHSKFSSLPLSFFLEFYRPTCVEHYQTLSANSEWMRKKIVTRRIIVTEEDSETTKLNRSTREDKCSCPSRWALFFFHLFALHRCCRVRVSWIQQSHCAPSRKIN